MNTFRNWYINNDTPITWFIIGMLFNNMLSHIALDRYGMAFFDLVLAGINFWFWRNNRV